MEVSMLVGTLVGMLVTVVCVVGQSGVCWVVMVVVQMVIMQLLRQVLLRHENCLVKVVHITRGLTGHN